MLAINSKSKHIEESWETIKFMRNKDADLDWAKFDLGGVATTVKVLNSPEAAKRSAWDMYRKELKYAKPWPAHPKIIAIARNVIAPYGQKAVIGEMSVKDAMRKAAEEAQKILDEDNS